MKQNISIIQNEREVIYNGVKTTVKPYILLPIGAYNASLNKATDAAYDHSAYDWFGDEYAALDANKIKEGDFCWDDVYVELDEEPIHVTNQWHVYSHESIDTPQSLGDLSYDEAKQLRSQVCIGSCYLADFENSFGIDRNDVSEACEAFQERQEDIYGEDEADDHLTADEFAEFITSNY